MLMVQNTKINTLLHRQHNRCLNKTLQDYSIEDCHVMVWSWYILIQNNWFLFLITGIVSGGNSSVLWEKCLIFQNATTVKSECSLIIYTREMLLSCSVEWFWKKRVLAMTMLLPIQNYSLLLHVNSLPEHRWESDTRVRIDLCRFSEIYLETETICGKAIMYYKTWSVAFASFPISDTGGKINIKIKIENILDGLLFRHLNLP